MSSRGVDSRPRFGLLVAAGALVLAAAGTMVQARLNAQLVATTGNPLEVSLVNLVVAAAVASVVIAVSPALRDSVVVTARAVRTGLLRPWMLLGGLLGGYYVAIQGSVSLAVGVAVFTVAVVAGQTGSALVVDRLGMGPMRRKDVTARRLVAALLAVIAVVVVASGRLAEPDSNWAGLVGIVALAASAGVASAIQQAVNGHVGSVSRRGITAAWVNFVGGGAAMLVVVPALALVTTVDLSPIPPGQWWLAVAGVFGLVYIATVSWVVRLVGVLVASLLTLVGLLAGSVLLDALVPTPGASVTWQLLAGVAITALAVLLASRPSR